MHIWINEVWRPSVTSSRVLLLDSLKTHKMSSVRTELEDSLSTEVEFIPPGITGLSQPIDERVMHIWINEVWRPSVTSSRVLLLDSLKTHKMSSVRTELEDSLSTEVEFIPPGITGLSQPIDERVMHIWINEVWRPSVTSSRVLLLDSLKTHKMSSVRTELEDSLSTEVEFIPPGITGLSQPIDERVMHIWINEVWRPSVTSSRVLLLDSLKTHKMSSVRTELEDSLSTEVEFIPPGITGLSQPIDERVMHIWINEVWRPSVTSSRVLLLDSLKTHKMSSVRTELEDSLSTEVEFIPPGITGLSQPIDERVMHIWINEVWRPSVTSSRVLLLDSLKTHKMSSVRTELEDSLSTEVEFIPPGITGLSQPIDERVMHIWINEVWRPSVTSSRVLLLDSLKTHKMSSVRTELEDSLSTEVEFIPPGITGLSQPIDERVMHIWINEVWRPSVTSSRVLLLDSLKTHKMSSVRTELEDSLSTEVEFIPPGITGLSQPIDERVMHIWINEVWRPSVTSSRVLLLDSLKTHKMSSVRTELEDSLSTEVEFIPPGITGLSQPIDERVMHIWINEVWRPSVTSSRVLLLDSLKTHKMSSVRTELEDSLSTEVEFIPPGITGLSQPIDERVMHIWINEVWRPSVTSSRVLLLDSLKTHKMSSVRTELEDSLSTEVEFIPPGITGLSQPIDERVMHIWINEVWRPSVTSSRVLLLDSLKTHKMSNVRTELEDSLSTEVEFIPPGITGLSQPIDERVMHIWINEVWRPSVTSSRVLLLDSLKTHKMSSVRTELEDSLSTEVEFIPPGITGLSQPIDERVMHIWINEVWRPSVTSSRVLLLDSLKTHKMSSVRTELEDSLSTEVEFIPPGITGLSQPIDERVMHIWINEVWRPSVTSSRVLLLDSLKTHKMSSVRTELEDSLSTEVEFIPPGITGLSQPIDERVMHIWINEVWRPSVTSSRVLLLDSLKTHKMSSVRTELEDSLSTEVEFIPPGITGLSQPIDERVMHIWINEVWRPSVTSSRVLLLDSLKTHKMSSVRTELEDSLSTEVEFIPPGITGLSQPIDERVMHIWINEVWRPSVTSSRVLLLDSLKTHKMSSVRTELEDSLSTEVEFIPPGITGLSQPIDERVMHIWINEVWRPSVTSSRVLLLDSLKTHKMSSVRTELEDSLSTEVEFIPPGITGLSQPIDERVMHIWINEVWRPSVTSSRVLLLDSLKTHKMSSVRTELEDSLSTEVEFIPPGITGLSQPIDERVMHIWINEVWRPSVTSSRVLLLDSLKTHKMSSVRTELEDSLSTEVEFIPPGITGLSQPIDERVMHIWINEVWRPSVTSSRVLLLDSLKTHKMSSVRTELEDSLSTEVEFIPPGITGLSQPIDERVMHIWINEVWRPSVTSSRVLLLDSLKTHKMSSVRTELEDSLSTEVEFIPPGITGLSQPIDERVMHIWINEVWRPSVTSSRVLLLDSLKTHKMSSVRTELEDSLSTEVEFIPPGITGLSQPIDERVMHIWINEVWRPSVTSSRVLLLDSLKTHKMSSVRTELEDSLSTEVEFIPPGITGLSQPIDERVMHIWINEVWRPSVTSSRVLLLDSLKTHKMSSVRTELEDSLSTEVEFIPPGITGLSQPIDERVMHIWINEVWRPSVTSSRVLLLDSLKTHKMSSVRTELEDSLSTEVEFIPPGITGLSQPIDERVMHIWINEVWRPSVTSSRVLLLDSLKTHKMSSVRTELEDSLSTEVEFIPPGITGLSQPIDERVMHIWINEVWRPSVTSSRVLLLDSLKTHKMSSVRTELEDSLSTEVEFIPPGITGLSQPIDERVMHIWINEVWRPSVTSSRVLLLDSLKTHKMSSVRTELEDSLSTEVEFIPPGITGLSQPIDERVMHIWINEVWRPSVTSSRVLLLDSLKTHKMSSVRTELEDSLSTEVEFIPPGITGLSQPIDERVMHIWINEVWRPSVTSSRVLLLDSLKTHKMSSVRTELEDSLSTEVEFIPPGITGLSQPIDERVMHIWINEVWRPSVTSSRVLLLDSLKTHKMSSVRTELEDSLSTEVEFIPPGITGLSQPIDERVMHIWINEIA
ncbi:hypothetical protein PF003_g19090 [Phytophthora fragariae]|nr:hypothetical protein PF003_g19090 [Phytophthora fragariae]